MPGYFGWYNVIFLILLFSKVDTKIEIKLRNFLFYVCLKQFILSRLNNIINNNNIKYHNQINKQKY